MNPLTYTVAETAHLLGCSRSTVEKMVRLGELPSVRTGVRRLLIPRRAVHDLVDKAEKAGAT